MFADSALPQAEPAPVFRYRDLNSFGFHRALLADMKVFRSKEPVESGRGCSFAEKSNKRIPRKYVRSAMHPEKPAAN